MDILTLDWETHYSDDYSLSHMTTESYIRDPRFETILCAVKWNDTPAFWLLPERLELFLTEEVDWAETTLLTHHAHFDGLILAHHYDRRPAFHLDTLSMARVVDGPKAGNSLYDLCKRHGLIDKGDYLVKMKGRYLADLTRDELAAFGRYACNDAEREYELAQKFLPQIPEAALRLIDLKIRMFTEPAFEGDIALLTEAVKSERERKAALLDVLGVDKKVFSSNDQFAALLRQVGVDVPMKESNTTGQPIPAFAKTDPGMQELLEHDDEIVRHLAETRLAVKSTIIETRAERFLGCAQRGRMPVYVKPYGAHTTRSSSGDKTNWQNMTSVNIIRPEMTVLKRSIRAPAGCKVVSADSSQIQARLVAWLFGQADAVEAFAQGRDVYSEFASQIYRRPIQRKKIEADFVPGQVGKISELSFMFQKGWYGASVDFLKGHLGAPPIQFTIQDVEIMGVDPGPFLNNPYKVQRVAEMVSRLELNDRLIHCLVSEAIVDLWRAKRDKVVAGWDLMEEVIDAMIAGQPMTFGPQGFLRTEQDAVVLPSGLKLMYRDVRRGDGGATYWTGRSREHVYGGSLTNNVVQGLEQEIVGAQTLAIADLGYKVATEAYDSVVCVVPDAQAQQCLADMTRIMKVAPPWAAGLPLASEGGIGQTYAECK